MKFLKNLFKSKKLKKCEHCGKDYHPKNWEEKEICFKFAHPRLRGNWKLVDWDYYDGHWNDKRVGAYFSNSKGEIRYVSYLKKK